MATADDMAPSAPSAPSARNVALVTLSLLMVPLVAMQFTREVNWGIGDFVAAGLLLFGAGMAYSAVARRVRSSGQRLAVAAAVVVVLGTVWAQLAVGLFD